MEYRNEFEQMMEEEVNSGYETYEGYVEPQMGMEQRPLKKGSGFAIASLVLGIVGMVFACCFFWLSFVLGIVGLVLGIISLVQGRDGKGMAVAGTILSGISFLIAALIGIVYLALNIWIADLDSVVTEEIYNGVYYEETYETPSGSYEEPSQL